MDTTRRHPLVLVVDPSPTLRKIMELVFNREGGEVIQYSDPVQVLKAARASNLPVPDIAFVHLTFSNLSAYYCIRYLKSHSPFKRIAIIAISKHDSCFFRLLAKFAGTIAYLPKPFTTAQLYMLALEHSQH